MVEGRVRCVCESALRAPSSAPPPPPPSVSPQQAAIAASRQKKVSHFYPSSVLYLLTITIAGNPTAKGTCLACNGTSESFLLVLIFFVELLMLSPKTGIFKSEC